MTFLNDTLVAKNNVTIYGDKEDTIYRVGDALKFDRGTLMKVEYGDGEYYEGDVDGETISLEAKDWEPMSMLRFRTLMIALAEFNIKYNLIANTKTMLHPDMGPDEVHVWVMDNFYRLNLYKDKDLIEKWAGAELQFDSKTLSWGVEDEGLYRDTVEQGIVRSLVNTSYDLSSLVD